MLDAVARSLAATSAMAVAVAACGSDPSDTDVDTEGPRQSEESDTSVDDIGFGTVAASDRAGWVIAGDAGPDGDAVWRLDADGAQQADPVPELVSLRSVGVEDGLAVAGLRCTSGGVDDCDEHMAELVRLDGRGEIAQQVTLWVEEGTIQDGDGLRIVGTVADVVWVDTARGLVPVSADGGVGAPVEDRARAQVCVIDGQLHSVVDREAGSGEPVDRSSPGEVPAEEVEAQPGGTSAGSVFDVFRYSSDEGEWQQAADSGREFERSTVMCGDDQIEVVEHGDSALIGRWTPDIGWDDVDAPRQTDIAAVSADGAFVQTENNEVLRRRPDGGLTPTGLSLPDPSPPDGPPPVIVAASSGDVTVGCTAGLGMTEPAESACDVSMTP